MNLTSRQLATVLAALRLYQFQIDFHGIDSISGMDQFQDGHAPLDTQEVNDLCEELNFSPVCHPPTAESEPCTRKMLVPVPLWVEVLDALAERTDRARYNEPESYDDEEHERNCRECAEAAESILAEARSIPVPDGSPEAEARRQKIIELAQEQCGDASIDDDAIISEGHGNGCAVSAWIWCDFTGTEFDTLEQPDEADFDPRAVTTGYTDAGID